MSGTSYPCHLEAIIKSTWRKVKKVKPHGSSKICSGSSVKHLDQLLPICGCKETADLQNLHIAHWAMQTGFLHVTKHLGTAGLTVFRTDRQTDRHVSKNLSSTHLRPNAQQRNQAKNVVTPSTMQITNSIPSEVAKVQQNNKRTK